MWTACSSSPDRPATSAAWSPTNWPPAATSSGCSCAIPPGRPRSPAPRSSPPTTATPRRCAPPCTRATASSWSRCTKAPSSGCPTTATSSRPRLVTRNIQYTNVCYFRCGFCAFSKGKLAANLRGEPYLVPHEEIVRRTVEAWERGATEVCLQGGIHPAFDGDYYASVVARSRTQCPRCTCTRSARSRSGRALATLGRTARRLPRTAPRRGPRLAARHRRRGPRRRGARRHLPGQDHDRAVARRPPHRAPRRAPLEQHDHVRPRRRPRELGPPPDRRPRPAARDRRLHRVRAAPVRPHGGPDLPERPRPPRPDVRRGAADARRRPARAAPLDREHPGLLGQSRAPPASPKHSAQASTTSAAPS